MIQFSVVALAVSLVWAREIPINNDSITADFPVDIEENFRVDQTAGCMIAINGPNVLPSPQPLFIIPGTNQFMFPQNRYGEISLKQQQQVELFCSGSGFDNPFNGVQTLLATCQAGDDFRVDGRTLKINQLRCIEQVEHVARRSRNSAIGKICPPNVTQIEIGFEVQNRFLWTMEICHDEVLESTQFSHYKLGLESNGFQKTMIRPQFESGNFFGGRDVDLLYTGYRQRQTIAGIIGQAEVDKLWDNDRDLYLARGHLAARADFIFESEQRATFYLVNAAPQWQSFNAGNWELIESSVRYFLSRRNIDAELFTGTFGIQELPDSKGVLHPLYLSFDAEQRGQIPVPKFYYKIVIDANSRRGVALVGVNNPHTTAEEIRSGKYTICRDVSDELDWVSWNRANLTMGYSYACDVGELAAVVKHLPASVRTTGLLV